MIRGMTSIVALSAGVAQLGNLYGWKHTIGSVVVVLFIYLFTRVYRFTPGIFWNNGGTDARGVRRLADLVLAIAAALADPQGGRDCALEASGLLDEAEADGKSRVWILFHTLGLAIAIPFQSVRRARLLNRNPTPTIASTPQEEKPSEVADSETPGGPVGNSDEEFPRAAAYLTRAVKVNKMDDEILSWIASLTVEQVREATNCYREFKYEMAGGPGWREYWFDEALSGRLMGEHREVLLNDIT